MRKVVIISAGLNYSQKRKIYDKVRYLRSPFPDHWIIDKFIKALTLASLWGGRYNLSLVNESKQLLYELLSKTNANLPILTEIAQAQILLHRIDDAEKTVGSFNYDTYRYPRLCTVQANIAIERNKIQKARKLFKAAKQLCDTFHCAHFGSGVLSLRLGDFSDAELSFEKLLNMDPKNVCARFGTALVHYFRGELSEALEIIQSILERETFVPAIEFAIGASLRVGALALSEKYLSLYQDVDKTNPRLHCYKDCLSHLRQNKPEKAIEPIESLLSETSSWKLKI